MALGPSTDFPFAISTFSHFVNPSLALVTMAIISFTPFEKFRIVCKG